MNSRMHRSMTNLILLFWSREVVRPATCGCIDAWMDGCIDACMDEWMDGDYGWIER